MTRKHVETCIKYFIVSLIVTFAAWFYRVLEMMSIVG